MQTPSIKDNISESNLYNICYYLDPDTTDIYVREIVQNNEKHNIYEFFTDIIPSSYQKINPQILSYFTNVCQTLY